MCYVNILIPPTRFRTGRTRPVHFRTFRGPFFTRSHQFRPGSDPFRSFSRADGSRTCAGHVASRLRRCYGFILFRFPALMSRAVAVSVVVRHPFTCIALRVSIFLARSLADLLGNSVIFQQTPQLCSISQILEDNIPPVVVCWTTSRPLLEKFYTLSLCLPCRLLRPSILDDRLFHYYYSAVTDSTAVVVVRLYYSSSSP